MKSILANTESWKEVSILSAVVCACVSGYLVAPAMH